MQTSLVLGADCGGTSSRVVVATAGGGIVGSGHAGPANPVVGDPVAAASQLAAAVRAALDGHDPARVAAVVVGMAGWSRLTDPAVADAYHRIWADLGIGCPVRTVGDAVVAFAAGTPEPSGAVLIAGTGAVAAAIENRAVARIADGLGWLLGDEGSAFWLGLAAARCTARSIYAGRPDTILVRAVRERIGGDDGDGFLAGVYALPRASLADLSRLVVAAARQGDPQARELLDDCADRLTGTLAALPPGDGPVVLAGALLSAVPEVYAAVQQRLAARLGRCGTVGTRPAVGAAWLAACDVGADDARSLHDRMLTASGRPRR